MMSVLKSFQDMLIVTDLQLQTIKDGFLCHETFGQKGS